MSLGSAMMLQPLKDTSLESSHLRDQGLWADRAATLLSHSALDQTEVTLSLGRLCFLHTWSFCDVDSPVSGG